MLLSTDEVHEKHRFSQSVAGRAMCRPSPGGPGCGGSAEGCRGPSVLTAWLLVSSLGLISDSQILILSSGYPLSLESMGVTDLGHSLEKR